MIITFSKEAKLIPNAKVIFYSDPYGENIINEINSNTNLESIVFNYSKIWLKFTEGVDFLNSDNNKSNLECIVSLVPYNWSLLMELTDDFTNDLFEIEDKKEGKEKFKNLIKILINLCLNNAIVAEMQRRIFNITSRMILKFIQYLKINYNENKEDSIENKFDFISQENFIEFVQKINLIFNDNNKNNNNNNNNNNNLISSFIVEGVEMILAILLYINEPFNTLSNYFLIEKKFNLPFWIEAILNLNQLLNFLNNNDKNLFDNVFYDEINEQNDISNSINEQILIFKNCNKDEVLNFINENKISIFDTKKDIIEFEYKNSKFLGLCLNGFLLSEKEEKKEEKEEKKEEEENWLCAYCKMENDKNNNDCVFCDKPKKAIVIKKEPKKKEENNNDQIKFYINKDLKQMEKN